MPTVERNRVRRSTGPIDLPTTRGERGVVDRVQRDVVVVATRNSCRSAAAVAVADSPNRPCRAGRSGERSESRDVQPGRRVGRGSRRVTRTGRRQKRRSRETVVPFDHGLVFGLRWGSEVGLWSRGSREVVTLPILLIADSPSYSRLWANRPTREVEVHMPHRRSRRNHEPRGRSVTAGTGRIRSCTAAAGTAGREPEITVGYRLLRISASGRFPTIPAEPAHLNTGRCSVNALLLEEVSGD